MLNPLKIRAHHLLCMQGYQGYGYSKIFEEHLDKIIKFLKETSEAEIEIVAENDSICVKCPHARGRFCQKDLAEGMKIRQIDLKVLEKLDLKIGTRGQVEQIFAVVKSKLKTCGDLVGICEECQWQEKCLWFVSRFV